MGEIANWHLDRTLIEEAVKLNIPIEVFDEKRRTQFLMGWLKRQVPFAEFDKIEIYKDYESFGYIVIIRKGDRALDIRISELKDIDDTLTAQIVLFCG